MPRTTPPDRLAKLLDAAAAAFVAHGYQRTQMDDVAERLGVSKGTVYRAVDSKEALFALVVKWADRSDELPSEGLTSALDVTAVAATVSAELAGAIAGLDLAAIVVNRSRLPSASAFGTEIERVAVGLHDVMRRRRTSIMVLDRCAAEIPDLADVWFGDGRYAIVDLWQAYLTQRKAHLANDIDVAILARTIVEIITTWAVKMPWDPSPRPYPDDTAVACATMVRNLLIGPAR